MTDPEEPFGKRQQTQTIGLPIGFPLYILAIALLVGACLSSAGLLVRNLGRVPLWGLLMMAGLVAAIGGTVAFLFADGGSPSDEEVENISTVPRGGEADRGLVELGRPRPEVGSRGILEEPWRENWPDDDLSGRAPPAPSTRTPVRTRPDLVLTEPEAVLPSGASPAPPPRAPVSPLPDSNLTELEADLLSRVSAASPLHAPGGTRPESARAELESIGAELDAIEREITSHRNRTKPAPR